MKKKLYIANVVSAKTQKEQNENTEWFYITERKLTKLGIDVWNPMAIEHEKPNLSWEEYIIDDLDDIEDYCYGIYLGKRYMESPGARLEITKAKKLGLEIHYE